MVRVLRWPNFSFGSGSVLSLHHASELLRSSALLSPVRSTSAIPTGLRPFGLRALRARLRLVEKERVHYVY